MDLEGLEDIPDFWDMKPDDDDESNIPIEDLTRPRNPLQSSTSRQNNTNPKAKTVQSILRTADEEHSSKIIHTSMRDTEPKKRADGKYKCAVSISIRGLIVLHSLSCNHTCKDKSACRHMW